MFVCYLIKSVPYRESARDAPCQLRDSEARFLEGCWPPSCPAAEERVSFFFWQAQTPFCSSQHTIHYTYGHKNVTSHPVGVGP